MPTETPASYIVRMSQTHDLDGKPKTSETVHTIESKFGKSTASQVIEFLEAFIVVHSDEPGVHDYTDPKTGTGQLRLEGFGRSTTAQIDDLILTQEVERELGQRDPFSPGNGYFLDAFIIRSNNPYIIVAIGLAAIALGIYAFIRGFDADTQLLAVTEWVVGAVITLVALILTARGTHRISWWTRARATAMRIAGRIPSNLRGL